MQIEVVLFDLGGVLVELGGMGDMATFAAEENEEEIWRRWLSCPWVRGEAGALPPVPTKTHKIVRDLSGDV